MRIHFLDSTRGLAALMVIIFHVHGLIFFDLTHIGESRLFNVLTTLFNGADAVSYFFVLSGFVLSYKYFNSDFDESIERYSIRRIFRIMPLYLFIVVLAYLILGSGLTKLNFVQEINLFAGANPLVKPGWSLSVEVALSLLVPYMVSLIKDNIKRSFFLVLILMLCYRWITCFTVHFLLGSLLSFWVSPKNTTKAHDYFVDMTSFKRLGIFLLLLLPYSLRFWIKLTPLKPLVDTGCEVINLQKDYFYFYISAFASCLAISIILREPILQRIFNLSPLTFLGKISFSLYLVHFPILKFFEQHYSSNLYNADAGLPTTILTYQTIIIGLSITAATITYYAIEKPFISIGKNVVAKIA